MPCTLDGSSWKAHGQVRKVEMNLRTFCLIFRPNGPCRRPPLVVVIVIKIGRCSTRWQFYDMPGWVLLSEMAYSQQPPCRRRRHVRLQRQC